jgi:hypothetical protein
MVLSLLAAGAVFRGMPVAASAAAGPAMVVSVASQLNDPVGRGTSGQFDSASGSISGSVSPSFISLATNPAVAGWSFIFAAPHGQRFAVGHFGGVVSAAGFSDSITGSASVLVDHDGWG